MLDLTQISLKYVLTVPRESDDPDSNESARLRFGDTIPLRVAWKH